MSTEPADRQPLDYRPPRDDNPLSRAPQHQAAMRVLACIAGVVIGLACTITAGAVSYMQLYGIYPVPGSFTWTPVVVFAVLAIGAGAVAIFHIRRRQPSFFALGFCGSIGFMCLIEG